MAKKFILPLVLVAVVAGLIFFQLSEKKAEEQKQVQSSAPKIGGSFVLTNQDGEKVSDSIFLGKKLLVYFGFTNCPSICPVSMSVITTAMEKIDPAKVQVVFITVDPERDTPETIKSFLKDYHEGTVGLTGSKEEIIEVIKSYRAFAEKTDDKGKDDYLMSHSDLIYLMDEEGKYLTHFNRENSPEEIANYVNSH